MRGIGSETRGKGSDTRGSVMPILTRESTLKAKYMGRADMSGPLESSTRASGFKEIKRVMVFGKDLKAILT